MPRPRRRDQLQDPSGMFHVRTRCTRGLGLLDDDWVPDGPPADDEGLLPIPSARDLIYGRLDVLTAATAVQVGAFALMDNHLHLLVRIDTEIAARWTGTEVARRWFTLHPPRRVGGADDTILLDHAANPEWVRVHRAKLCSFSQFVKDLKQHVAQVLNRRWKQSGAFWQGRCKISRASDDANVLAMLTYIDLNPHAAGLVDLPEQGQHTSLAARLAAWEGTTAAPETATPSWSGVTRWLLSLGDDPEGSADARGGNPRRSLLPGMTLQRYLTYLDGVARRMRRGKASLGAAAKSVFERLNEEAQRVYPPGAPRRTAEPASG